MPITTFCPACKREYLLADAQLGKRVRCKDCNESFYADEKREGRRAAPEMIAPADDTERPVRRRRPAQDDGADERPPRRRRNAASGRGLLIGLLLGGAVLLIGLVLIVWLN